MILPEVVEIDPPALPVDNAKLSDTEVVYQMAKVPESLWALFLLADVRLRYDPVFTKDETVPAKAWRGNKRQRVVSEWTMALKTRHTGQWAYMRLPAGILTEEEWRAQMTALADFGYTAGGQPG